MASESSGPIGPPTAARALAANRMLIGGLLVLSPTRGARGWIGGREAERPGARLFARALGARDAGIALGTLRALARDEPARPWAVAALISDGVDFMATLAARRELPGTAFAFGSVMSGLSTGLGVWLSTALDRRATA
jgi:hypothetical protein